MLTNGNFFLIFLKSFAATWFIFLGFFRFTCNALSKTSFSYVESWVSWHRIVFNSRLLKGRKTPAPILVQKKEQQLEYKEEERCWIRLGSSRVMPDHLNPICALNLYNGVTQPFRASMEVARFFSSSFSSSSCSVCFCCFYSVVRVWTNGSDAPELRLVCCFYSFFDLGS